MFPAAIHSQMFKIKICGITTPEDALLAASFGADAIGLNFYEKSPRYIAPERASEILSRLRENFPAKDCQAIGVYVNASLDDIVWTLRAGDLYAPGRGFGIQLHGNEPPEFLRELYQHGLGPTNTLFQASGHVPVVPIVRAYRCTTPDLTELTNYIQNCQKLQASPQAVLLDAHAPGSYGGTGQRLDWNMVRDQREKLLGLPLILAGGLTPDNVSEAILTARPDAIDVASGVESSPGKKDPARLRDFITNAKAAFTALAGRAKER